MDILPRAGKGVQQDALPPLQLVKHPVLVQGVFGQPAAQLPFLQQGLHVLLQLPLEGAHPLLDPRQLRNEHHRPPRVLEQGRGPIEYQRDVFVQGRGLSPRPQPLAVRQQVLLLRRSPPAPQARRQRLDGPGQLFRIVVDDFRRRRDGHLFQALSAPLGQQIEVGNGVQRVAPQLEAHRRRAVGGIHVDDPAPHRELPRPLNLIAPLIPRAHQRRGQIAAGQGRPLPQPQRPAQQHVGRQGELGRRVGAGHHALVVPRRHLRQRPQPHLLVFPGGGFHPPQG